jgi:hypothetical protein
MLKNGTHATIAEIAAVAKINESHVGRVLRLTLLAPDIIEAILSGRQPAELQLDHGGGFRCSGANNRRHCAHPDTTPV